MSVDVWNFTILSMIYCDWLFSFPFMFTSCLQRMNLALVERNFIKMCLKLAKVMWLDYSAYTCCLVHLILPSNPVSPSQKH